MRHSCLEALWHLLLALALMAASPDVQRTPARAAAAQKAHVVKKVATLLEDARFKYRKAEEGICVINFKGQNSDSIDVVSVTTSKEAERCGRESCVSCWPG